MNNNPRKRRRSRRTDPFHGLKAVLSWLSVLSWLVVILAGCAAKAPGPDAVDSGLTHAAVPATTNSPPLDRPESATPGEMSAQPREPKMDVSLPGLQSLDFFPARDNGLGIRLEAQAPIVWTAQPAHSRQLRIVLADLRAPAALTKLYQLYEFDHPVKSALLRNTDQGLELLLSATARIEVDAEQLGRELVLRVQEQTVMVDEPLAGSSTSAPGMESQANQDGGQDTLRERTLFPGMRESYEGEKISIDLQNAEVEHVLRLIGEVAGYNLILDPEVGGKISMKLDNVPWDQILDLVLVQKNLGMVIRGNILRISTAQRLEAERDQVRRARQAEMQAREAEMQAQETIQRLEPVQTTYIQVNYATAAEMDARTQPFLSERGRTSVDPRTNTLIVTDAPVRIRQIQAMVDRLDKPERQVLIEARVVYATDDFQRGLGVQWGGGIEGVTTEYYRGLYGTAGAGAGNTPGGVGQTGYLVNTPLSTAPTFGIGGFISKLMGPDMFTLDAQLQLGEVKNQAQTVSSPRIVTLNNQRAEIEQGTRIAVQVADERGTRTDYVDAVLKLSVMPQITPDDKLILDLEISDDNPSPDGQDVETKSTRTKLMVEDGQTLVGGGVLKATQERLENRVPGLADVPGLGWLFKSRLNRARNQELLIFIRPSIL